MIWSRLNTEATKSQFTNASVLKRHEFYLTSVLSRWLHFADINRDVYFKTGTGGFTQTSIVARFENIICTLIC